MAADGQHELLTDSRQPSVAASHFHASPGSGPLPVENVVRDRAIRKEIKQSSRLAWEPNLTDGDEMSTSWSIFFQEFIKRSPPGKTLTCNGTKATRSPPAAAELFAQLSQLPSNPQEYSVLALGFR